jgi:hypothetical protein
MDAQQTSDREHGDIMLEEESHQAAHMKRGHDGASRADGGAVPLKKRKNASVATDSSFENPSTKRSGGDDGTTKEESSARFKPKSKKVTPDKAKALRLDQNRKAARESRKRKKVMIEELQRSLVFFSKANAALKHKNDDLARLLVAAHAELAKSGESVAPLDTLNASEMTGSHSTAAEAAAATVPQLEASSTGGAFASIPAMSTLATSQVAYVPPMEPGTTMQAMAHFQQAALAAMQAAAQGMQALDDFRDPESHPVLSPQPADESVEI